MEKENLKALFQGSNNDYLLFALHRKIRFLPQNEVQRVFMIAWDAIELVNSDGLSKLLEQRPSLEEYGQVFVKVGLGHVKPIFDRAIALFPAELRDTPLYELAHSKFDELNVLTEDFFRETTDLTPLFKYLREHESDFAEFLNED